MGTPSQIQPGFMTKNGEGTARVFCEFPLKNPVGYELWFIPRPLRTTTDIGVLFGWFAQKIEGSGLDGVDSIYQGRPFFPMTTKTFSVRIDAQIFCTLTVAGRRTVAVQQAGGFVDSGRHRVSKPRDDVVFLKTRAPRNWFSRLVSF